MQEVIAVTCAYFAPLTSGELAEEKLLLLIVLHSSSLALGKGGLSLTGGQNKDREDGSQTGTAQHSPHCLLLITIFSSEA